MTTSDPNAARGSTGPETKFSELSSKDRYGDGLPEAEIVGVEDLTRAEGDFSKPVEFTIEPEDLAEL